MQPSVETADRLRLLTLSLERALAEENWNEVHDLLCERGRLVGTLTQRYLSNDVKSILSDIQLRERKLLESITKNLSAVGLELGRTEQSKRNIAAYRKSC